MLREATVADVQVIAKFQTCAWRQAYSGLVPSDYLTRIDSAARAIRWGERLATGARQVALAEAGGAVVGVVSWAESRSRDETPPLELKSLYLEADRHGSGLATALLQHAIGRDDAYLWCFRENPRAVAFYAKQGFRRDGATAVDPDTGVPEIRLVRVSRTEASYPRS